MLNHVNAKVYEKLRWKQGLKASKFLNVWMLLLKLQNMHADTWVHMTNNDLSTKVLWLLLKKVKMIHNWSEKQTHCFEKFSW